MKFSEIIEKLKNNEIELDTKIKCVNGTYICKKAEEGTLKLSRTEKHHQRFMNYNNIELEFEIVEDKVWKPKMGEESWFLWTDGKIGCISWENTTTDKDKYNVGNCYKTREQVEKARNKQILLTELTRYAQENNEEKINWNNKNQKKWHICKIHNEIQVNWTWYYQRHRTNILHK